MTTRKKIISILLFLLIIAAFVFVVYWLVSRHQAAKTGNPPSSFKQFLGFETSTTPPSETTGTLSSNFTQENDSGTTTGSGTSSIATNTSQFTNDIVTPNNTSSLVGNNTSPENSSTPSAANNTDTTGAPVVASGTSGPICTDADVNITFTPSELSQLQALQNQFYAIAQTLHTDADVANEESNYTNFELKNAKLKGLIDFCTAAYASQRITTTAYTNKVPTPFWYVPTDIRSNGPIQYTYDDPSNPSTPTGVIETSTPLGYLGIPGQIGGDVDVVYRDPGPANGLRTIEQVLRLNLW